MVSLLQNQPPRLVNEFYLYLFPLLLFLLTRGSFWALSNPTILVRLAHRAAAASLIGSRRQHGGIGQQHGVYSTVFGITPLAQESTVYGCIGTQNAILKVTSSLVSQIFVICQPAVLSRGRACDIIVRHGVDMCCSQTVTEQDRYDYDSTIN